jgi:hypothetical protein
VRHAGRGNSSSYITLAIAGMHRCSTVCAVRGLPPSRACPPARCAPSLGEVTGWHTVAVFNPRYRDFIAQASPRVGLAFVGCLGLAVVTRVWSAT